MGEPYAGFKEAGAGDWVLVPRQSSTLSVKAWGRNSPGLLGSRHYGPPLSSARIAPATSLLNRPSA
jgi:hypothetical protein